jgi:flagellar biosynthesis protein FlhG
MVDQASELRQQVRRAGASTPPTVSSPKLLVVTGAKGGVGTSSVAVNLAVAMSRHSRKVVLVDADFDGADIATLCGIDEQHSIADVLAGRRSAANAIQDGPEGIRVLPGAWAREQTLTYSALDQQQLIDDLRKLGHAADVIVIDTGSGLNSAIHRFWQAADQVMLVTTPEPVAIMDAYAAIKVLRAGDSTIAVHCLINRIAEIDEATEVHERIACACRKFLGMELGWAGAVAEDPSVATSAQEGRPLLITAPNSQAADDLRQVAERLIIHGRIHRQSGSDMLS